jgi:hypothetical protein
MAMSDCWKCWNTPCECGFDYETWDNGRIAALREVLDDLLIRRKAGEPIRKFDCSTPARIKQPSIGTLGKIRKFILRMVK